MQSYFSFCYPGTWPLNFFEKFTDSELEDVTTPDILHKSDESNNMQVPHHAKRVDIETIEKVGPIPKNTEKSTGIVDIISNTSEIWHSGNTKCPSFALK